MADRFQPKIDAYADKHDCDVVAYFGDIIRGEDTYFIKQCRKRVRRKNILLLLATRGGDANAAYRIARAFQRAYKTVAGKQSSGQSIKGEEKVGDLIVCVDGICKSAGTLICIGADKLLMSDNAELGPIDAQVRKQDEVGERTSGLTPMQAIQFLETQSVLLFKRHFRSLRDPEELGFSTKMAGEFATNISVGLLTSIYQQLDPIRLAEMDRSLRIAKEYGERLKTDNVREETIEQLLVKYPSHAFVIDKKEARTLYNKVEDPDNELMEIVSYFEPLARLYIDKENETFAFYLSGEPTPPAPAEAPAGGVAPQNGG
jgi:hypothetical protein